MGCVDGMLVCIGGCTDEDAKQMQWLKRVDAFDPAAGKWRALPEMLVPRQWAAATAVTVPAA